MEASTLVKALQVRTAGTVLRGFGDHTFSPSVPDIACGHARGADRSGMENVAVDGLATTGLAPSRPISRWTR